MDSARSSGDRLPFLTGSCYGHKNSWLYPKTSQLEVTKVIFWLSGQVFQKFSRDRWKITIFLERKSRNRLFFNFFITKVSYFVSNLNDDFHEASFEVYYISVSQKLTILGFSPQIFFILTSVTSDTSWGQTMSLSDLNEVSNFSWRYQLSYETMFVWSVPKLECPEIAISQWVILTPPHP